MHLRRIFTCRMSNALSSILVKQCPHCLKLGAIALSNWLFSFDPNRAMLMPLLPLQFEHLKQYAESKGYVKGRRAAKGCREREG